MRNGFSDLPSPLVVSCVEGVRSNRGSLGHGSSPRRPEFFPHVMVGSMGHVAPVVSIEFVDDLQGGSPKAVSRGFLYVAGESFGSRSAGSGCIEGAESVGFFDDPHDLGVVSAGTVEDYGSDAPHSHFTLVSRL